MTRIFKITILALAVSFIQACDSKLEITDPNRLSADAYYTTEGEAVAAVDAIYNTLIIDGLFQRVTPIYNDGRGDEALCRSPWTFMTGFSNFTLPASDAAGEIAWVGYYIMVSRANQAIENIPNVPDLDDNLRNRLLGQAYFFRAFAHFQLANFYGNPLIITSTPKSQEEFYPSNEGVTKQMVYDQVQADLEVAIPLLPGNYNGVSGPDLGQVGRITSGAANALMGQLLLYQGLHSAAAPYFAAVINSNEYSLAPNYADIFSGVDALESSDPGRIFWAEFTESTNPDFNWGGDPLPTWRQFTALAPTYSVADFYDFRPTQFLYDEMRQERTIDGNLDPRYHATILSYEPTEGYTTAYGDDWFARGFAATDFFIKKYTRAATGGDAFTAGYNYPIIRYSDVLLMYAECLANTGNISGAASHVQTVRDRANLPDREAEFAGYSLDQFMDQLAHERVCELALEGKRWYDIMRWGWLDNATKLAELQANDAEFNTFVAERKVLPIPLTELDRNPNLVGTTAN